MVLDSAGLKYDLDKLMTDSKVGSGGAKMNDLATALNNQGLNDAIEFGYNCIDSFKSVFGEKTIDEKAKELADILYNWLRKNTQNRYSQDFLKSYIYTYGPNQLRNKDNLEMALWRLHNDSDIDYFAYNKPAFIRLRNNNYLL